MNKFVKGIVSNTAFGFLVGVVTAFLFVCFIDPEVSEWARENGVALASAVVTIAAALLALSGILYDVSQQEGRNTKVRNAKLAAAKAVLPMALAELYRISQNRIDYEITRDPKNRLKDWVISGETMAIIKECIEFAEGTPRQCLSDLPSAYQILMAHSDDRDRAIELPDHASLPWFGENGIQIPDSQKRIRFSILQDWASFRSLVEIQYKWARGVSDEMDRSRMTRLAIAYLTNISNPLDKTQTMSVDPIFRQELEKSIQTQDFWLSDPNWRVY